MRHCSSGAQDLRASLLRHAVGRRTVTFILHGDGKNGKSTFTKALQTLLGPYAVQAAETLLLEKGPSGTHPTEVADLKGSRIAVCSETPKGKHFDDNRVKALTGGDRITARRMREDFWTFDPTHKLWIATNNRPSTREISEAMRRRLRFVPFEVTITETEKDPDLDRKLRSEMSGILTWAFYGCLWWQWRGLGTAAKVDASTSAYFAEQDPVRRWIEASCIVGPNEEANATTLYRGFTTSGDSHLTQTEFGKRLTDLGYGSKRTKHGVCRTGLSLAGRGY